MFLQEYPSREGAGASSPFLPLAFRLGASFGLLTLQLALPGEGQTGELFYIAALALLFVESVWECARAIKGGQAPFATPSAPWIRFNLLLDMALVTLLISFQGVDQERLATIYLFPVLASAFYLAIHEIAAVGILSALFHIASVLLFTYGWLPAFGRSSEGPGLEPGQLAFILGFASLQICAATLVVVAIRKHLESLSRNLSQSEAVVDELSAMYRRMFESMLSGLITVDLQGRILSANPAAEAILGRSLGPGTPIAEQGFGDLTDLESTLKERRFEVELDSPEGGRHIVGGNLVALRGAEGAANGHLLVFQDLTEIKVLEQRTRLSERLAAVGELSSEMAHELRNPMASILGCVQILRQGEQSGAKLDRLLNILGRESERVSAIVTDFLDFTRPRPARIQPIRLHDLVEDLLASWETDPRSEGFPVAAEAPPELWVQGDPVWVHQIFTNLLSNARKALAAAQDRTIRLGFDRRGRTVTVVVRDRGCGMAGERLRALFIPFASGFEEGNGLGMSLVYQFVKQMGWDIRVESALGQGTSVFLTLPVTEGLDKTVS